MKRFLVGLLLAVVVAIVVAVLFPHAFGGNRLIVGVLAFGVYVVADAITTPRKPRNAASE